MVCFLMGEHGKISRLLSPRFGAYFTFASLERVMKLRWTNEHKPDAGNLRAFGDKTVMAVTGKTKVYGVIGDPIDHSLSPIMHNAAFNSLNLDAAFLAFQVQPTEVENAIQGMRALNILGLNVTMPHKKAVIRHLDEIDQTALFLNAVNTIHNKNGKLYGFNTDGMGAL
jgi:hypothetical protein